MLWRPADGGVRQSDSHVLFVYLAVGRSAVQITHARLLVEGKLGAGPVDVEGQRVGRPVSKHAYEVERGEHLGRRGFRIGGLRIARLHLMLQLSLRRCVKVRRVDLDEAIDELGDEVGLEIGMVAIGPAQDVDERGKVRREDRVGWLRGEGRISEMKDHAREDTSFTREGKRRPVKGKGVIDEFSFLPLVLRSDLDPSLKANARTVFSKASSLK